MQLTPLSPLGTVRKTSPKLATGNRSISDPFDERSVSRGGLGPSDL